MRIAGMMLLLSSLMAPSLYADDSGFHNMLSVSRSILSPSQYYQVKEGGRVEANFGLYDGNIHYDSPAVSNELEIKGTQVGLKGFLALNPEIVLGIGAEQLNQKYEDTLTTRSLVIDPSVTYSPIAPLSFGLKANFYRGEFDPSTGPSQTINSHNFTLGMTAHENGWEATLFIESENKDTDSPQNSRAQTLGLQGRYYVLPLIAVGLSYLQSDYAAIAPANTSAKIENQYGLHIEPITSESFALEIDYFSTTNAGGADAHDATELILQGQALLSSTVEAGARISYKTIKAPGSDYTLSSPALFIATRF